MQPAQAGTYTVVVTNVTGAVEPPAMLSVIPPVERRMVPGLALLGQPGSLLNLEDADTLGPSPAWVTLDSVILPIPPNGISTLLRPCRRSGSIGLGRPADPA